MMVNKVQSLKQVLNQEYPQFIDERRNLETLFKSFEEFKRTRHMLTYDDLLVRFREALEASATMREQLSDQYRYIMVDEYQDTNKLQAQIVKLMTARHENVAVVGDEFQSIYSFRGASHRNMLEFPKLFPTAQIIKLEENFRSTQPILDVANAIIADVKESYKKRLYSRIEGGEPPVVVSARDENEQSRFVAQRIAELRDEGVPLAEIAVLFRSSSHSFDLEIELGQTGHSVSQVWRDEVCGVGAHQRCARVSARGRQTFRHALVVSHVEADRPYRRRDCLSDSRTSRRRTERLSLGAYERRPYSKSCIASRLGLLTRHN